MPARQITSAPKTPKTNATRSIEAISHRQCTRTP
jgi:hypothetical protein